MSTLGTLAGTFGRVTGLNPVGGLASTASSDASNFMLQKVSSWVLKGTRGALEQVAGAIGAATAPNLESTWFSTTYWRVAALAAMLTLPFLCAAAVQAVARADLGLLARAAFGYLPLSVLGVSLAAPLTMLLLAATDQMSGVVSASAATGGARFLDRAAGAAGALAATPGGSAFFAVIVGLLAVMAALALAVELLVRSAAVYVVVLMLPLAFAALVWPARRIWAVRLVELLVSLILSKFAIVAVLSLAATAFGSRIQGVGELLVAMALILLSTFAPWALLRILPFTEVAAGAAGILRNELPHSQAGAATAWRHARGGADFAHDLPARMRSRAAGAYAQDDGAANSTGDDRRLAATSDGTSADTAVPAAMPSPDTPSPASPSFDTPEPGTPSPDTPSPASPSPDAPESGRPSPPSSSPGTPEPGPPTDVPQPPTVAPQPGLAASAPPTVTPSDGFVLPADWKSDEPMGLGSQLLDPLTSPPAPPGSPLAPLTSPPAPPGSPLAPPDSPLASPSEPEPPRQPELRQPPEGSL